MEGPPHVLIIGAGMTGLLLAQALKTRGIGFSIYERDPNAQFRGPGWGLAIHWAKNTMLSLLPTHLQERMLEANVDPEAALRGDCGRFPMFSLASGEKLFENLSDTRIRVSRERLRLLLMSDLNIKWEKKLDKIVQKPYHDITVEFTDASTAHGTHIVGCDGARSRVRDILSEFAGTTSRNDGLDVRFLGCSVELPSSIVEELRKLDTLFFQAHHPTGSFMFFGIQETPAINEHHEYQCQVNVSWPYRGGFLDRKDPTEVPDSQEERLSLIRHIASSWTSPFRDTINAIPTDTPLQEIKLEDWTPPDRGAWNNLHGRATLVGDAAHPMTMYRGEAVNHGITDVQELIETYLHKLSNPGEVSDSQEACDAYEERMIERTRHAVKASRQACIDAHYSEEIKKDSPLVSKRAIVA